MTDLDLPPDSPLPDGVRSAALTRLRAGLHAPPPRRQPLKIAAIAVAVVTATTLAAQLADRGDHDEPDRDPELPLPDARSLYDVRDNFAPEGAAQRCRDQVSGCSPSRSPRPTGRWPATPGPTPIPSGSRPGPGSRVVAPSWGTPVRCS